MMDDPTPDGTAPRRIGMRAFRENLAGCLREVRQGRTLLVTSRDQVVAEIHPPRAVDPRRRPGALAGRIDMAPDFDVLPPDVLAVLEGREG